MARPVGADAEATKARILEAAGRLVAARGIDGTSIRDVAAESGVSLATVLHYYGSKEGLHDAVVDAMYRELDEMKPALFAALAEPGITPRDLLANTVRAAWKFVRSHIPAHKLLLRHMIDTGGMSPERRESQMRPFLDDIGAVLAPFLGRDPLHVRMSAQTVVHAVVRYSLHSPAELKLIANASTDAEAERRVVQHLIDVACALLIVDDEHKAAKGRR